MTRTPIAGKSIPLLDVGQHTPLPRPVPIPAPREKWSEEEQQVIDEYTARDFRDRTLDYDPYA